MTSLVSKHPAASSDIAAAHFRTRLSLETDCADVHASLKGGRADFVLLDTRGGGYSEAHVPGAISLPHREIDAERMKAWPQDTLFVVYCAGPHCNAADQAAMKLAQLGLPVKIMIGGLTGWADEGYSFARGSDTAKGSPAAT